MKCTLKSRIQRKTEKKDIEINETLDFWIKY